MIKKDNDIFKKGLTLAEVLIALTTVGIISILVIPGLIKGINANGNMAKLQKVVTDVNNVTAREFLKHRTDVVDNTDLISSPASFLKNLDCIHNKTPFASQYYNKYGSTISVSIPQNGNSGQAQEKLKNGAGVGIYNGYQSRRASAVFIDVNGPDKPNIAGEDFFIAFIMWDDDPENGYKSGDIGSHTSEGTSKSTLKSNCQSGNAAACYKFAEMNNFDGDYMEK